MGTPGTRPLRKDAERNRLRILAAAAEVFAERGLTASLDDIAHRAEVGVGTVYRRFPDKEALIDALFEQRIEVFEALAREALEMPDGWEGFVFFLDNAACMQARDRGLKELLHSTAEGMARVAGVRQRIAPIVEAIVARAQASGALREDIGPNDIPMLNLMIGTIADASRDIEPDLWRRYLDVLLAGLRAQPAPPAPLAGPPLEDAKLDAFMQAWRPPAR